MRFETLENNLFGQGAYDVRARGNLIFRTAQSNPKLFREAGMWEATMRLPSFFFNEMTYSVVPSLTVARPGDDPSRPRDRGYTVVGEPLSFIVYGPGGPGADRSDKAPRKSGVLAPIFKWKFQRLDDPTAVPVAEDAARA